MSQSAARGEREKEGESDASQNFLSRRSVGTIFALVAGPFGYRPNFNSRVFEQVMCASKKYTPIHSLLSVRSGFIYLFIDMPLPLCIQIISFYRHNTVVPLFLLLPSLYNSKSYRTCPHHDVLAMPCGAKLVMPYTKLSRLHREERHLGQLVSILLILVYTF